MERTGELCKECNGTCSVKIVVKETNEICRLPCPFCFGTGKLDWIFIVKNGRKLKDGFYTFAPQLISYIWKSKGKWYCNKRFYNYRVIGEGQDLRIDIMF